MVIHSNFDIDFEKLAETFREMVDNARDLGIDTVPNSPWKKLYTAVRPYAEAGDWRSVNQVMRELGGLLDNNPVQLFESLDRHFGKPREYMHVPIEGDMDPRKKDILRVLDEVQSRESEYYRPLLQKWEQKVNSLGEKLPNSNLPKSLFSESFMMLSEISILLDDLVSVDAIEFSSL